LDALLVPATCQLARNEHHTAMDNQRYCISMYFIYMAHQASVAVISGPG
jgi:hypothetical protein